MKKAVGYCRVSTDGQVGEDKFGIDSQKEQILEYAKRNDYEILEWFIDEGVSGVKAVSYTHLDVYKRQI